MNTNTSSALLLQYNKDAYKKKLVDTQATDANKQIGTWSYANMYDALYDKFSGYKNFNINMWRDALKLGEQDQYFAFLEANKENQLSNQFYDDNYYDYETMMLEMYLPFADTTNSEMRTTDIFDPVTNKWIEQEIGNMSDRQYIQYQLDGARERQEAEIQHQLEIEEKENRSFWENLGGDFLASVAEFGEGVLSFVAGVGDFVAAPFYAGYQAISGQEDFGDAFVDYYADKGLTALEKKYVRDGLDLYERKYTHFRDIDGNITNVGKFFAQLPNTIGNMVPSILINMATGGAYSIGQISFYTNIFSSNMYDAATNPYTKDSPALLMIGNAAIKAGVEAVIEWGLGKVVGPSATDRLRGMIGKDFNIKGLTKWTGLKYLGKSAIQEGTEEFLQDFSTHLVNVFTDMIYEGYGNDGVTIQTLIDSFVMGTLSSLVMSGGQITTNAITSGITNRAAKKAGKYNTDLDYGPGDIVVETEDGIQKLNVANRIYFSSILSDFEMAVDKLRNEKFGREKNIELAQEVYGALTALSQFYSTFDKERIKNCERLLARVIKMEKAQLAVQNDPRRSIVAAEQYGLSVEVGQNLETSSIGDVSLKEKYNADARKNGYSVGTKDYRLSREKDSFLDRTYRNKGMFLRDEETGEAYARVYPGRDAKGNATYAYQTHYSADNLANYITATVNDMIGNVGPRVKAKIKKAVEENKEKLYDNGVTEVKGVIDENGENYGKELDKILTNKGQTELENLRKGYEWLILTDGHIAASADDIIFIPVAWLENYKTSDIYNFLIQSELISDLVSEKELKPLWKSAKEIYTEFTGRKRVNGSEVVMQFLFNPTVYQKVLLSNAGKNAHEFKKWIFQFYDTIKRRGDATDWSVIRGETAQKRKRAIDHALREIKKAHREGALKAIFNWGFELDEIKAWDILTKTDLKRIEQYRHRKLVLNQPITGKMTSAHKNLFNDFMTSNELSEAAKNAIALGHDENATINQQFEARLIMELFDNRVNQIETPSAWCQQVLTFLENRLRTLRGLHESEVLNNDYYKEQLNSHVDALYEYLVLLNETYGFHLSEGLTQKISDTIDDMHARFYYMDDDGERHNIDPSFGSIAVLNANVGTLFNEAYKELLSLRGVSDETSEFSFVIPYHAIPLDTPEDHSIAQYVADVLNEFEKDYGIPARQMVGGDLTGMSASQIVKLRDDMKVLDIEPENLPLFVFTALENRLGSNFCVVPVHDQTVARIGFKHKDFSALANLRREKDTVHDRLSRIISDIIRDFSDRGNIVIKDTRVAYLRTGPIIDTMEDLLANNDIMSMLNRREEGRKFINDYLSRRDKPTDLLDFFLVANFDGVIYDVFQAIDDEITAEENRLDDEKISATESTAFGVLQEYEFLRNRLDDVGRDIEKLLYRTSFDYRNGDISASRAESKVEEFIRLKNKLFASSIYDKFSTDSIKHFYEKLSQLKQKNPIDALKFILDSKFEIRKMFSELARNIEYEKNAYVRVLDNRTNIVDFQVITKIPAERLLGDSFSGLDDSEKDDVVKDILSTEYQKRKFFNDLYAHIEQVLRDEPDLRKNSDVQALLNIINTQPDDAFYWISDFKSPISHESLASPEEPLEVYRLIGTFMRRTGSRPTPASARLSDFLDIGQFSDEVQKVLRGVWVSNKSLPGGVLGQTDGISFIDMDIDKLTMQGENITHTLVHEINHFLQRAYNISNGFNTEQSEAMIDLLKYVALNYETAVREYLGPLGSMLLYGGDIDWVLTEDSPLIEPLGYIAYKAVSGEIWAETYQHNKDVRGFSRALFRDGEYLISPDGTKKFKIDRFGSGRTRELMLKESTPKTPVALTENTLYTSIRHVIETRAQGLPDIENPYVRGTYHTRLTQNGNDIVNSLVDKSKTKFLLRMPTVDDLIKEPMLFSKEVLDYIGNDFSEGNITSAVRTYLEDNFESVSLDRTGNTHRYVLVDDNAYDDMFLPSIYDAAADDKNTSLYEKYKNTDGIPLSAFYKASKLKELGITDDVKVIINPSVASEAVFDENNRQGIIYINANEKTTNARLMDKINHEFRHILQRYNIFETGFTPNFKVTKEMIADVKHHVPELFKDNDIKTWAILDAKNKNQSWEASIVQCFVYGLVGGELNAYSIDASLITTKTIYVTYEAGKPTIFMPWYDAKSGEGRYKTDFIAARSDDKSAPIKLSELPGISLRDMPQPAKRKKVPQTRIKVTQKLAGDSNLKYFLDYRNLLDEPLADFIEATTGHEKELPPALWNAIKEGALTRTAFESWFRTADDINEFTFDLINKYIYKNDNISSLEELDAFVKNVEYYKGIFTLLVRHGANLSSLLVEHNFDEFMSMLENVKQFYFTTVERKYQDEKKIWHTEKIDVTDTFAELAKLIGLEEFGKFDGRRDGLAKDLDVSYSEKDLLYARNFAMEFFDGTPGGAFFVAHCTRKLLYKKYVDEIKKSVSGDKTVKGEKGDDKDTTLWDALNPDDMDMTTTENRIGNDIIALYEKSIEEKEAKKYISHTYHMRLVRFAVKAMNLSDEGSKQARKALLNIEKTKERFDELKQKNDTLTDKEKNAFNMYRKFLKIHDGIASQLSDFKNSLDSLSTNATRRIYDSIRDAEIGNLRLPEDFFDLSKYQQRNLSTDGKIELDAQGRIMTRERIQARLKGKAQTLINMIGRKEIKFEDLPEDIREMFAYEETYEESVLAKYARENKIHEKDVPDDILDLYREVYVGKYSALKKAIDSKKIILDELPEKIRLAFEHVLKTGPVSPRKFVALKLKSEYSGIGERGRNKIERAALSDLKYDYVGKRDIDEKDDAYKHDISALADKEIRLEQTLQRMKDLKKAKARAKKAADEVGRKKSAALRKAKAEADAKVREITKENKQLKRENKELKVKTDFLIKRSKKQKKQTGLGDIKNNFTIMSGIQMPEVLVKLLDVSFNKTADTLVQFASKDVNGNFYYKIKDENGKLKPVIEDFDSLVKHEIANWDTYFEAVRNELQVLTRSDVLSIVDFIKHGAITLGPNANKLLAIQVYILGYVVDCAEKNSYSWNFSDAEKADFRELYESIASIGGTILTSVKQMRDTVNPFEKIKQRMFDDWISVSPTDTDKLFKSVENMRNEKDVTLRNKKAADILKTIEDWEKREFETRNKNYKAKRWSKEWWKRLGEQVVSFRYLAMLSGPATWIRNQVSDVMTLSLNTMSDLTAKAIFVKRGYRDDQWDLTNTKVSPEVKAFLDKEIKQNKLLAHLYNMSGKYDDRPGAKLAGQMELFVSIISKRFEDKYAAEHRFDKATLNFINKVINKMMTDAHFIKFVSNRYFGKILTIEVAKGNVSLDEGLSNKILNLFAEAVILGNQEYMHKRSWLANMVDGIREKNPVAHTALTLWMPFLNSSWNWYVELLKYNPVALLGSIWRLNHLEQRIDKITKMRNDPKRKRELTVDNRFTQYLLRRDVGKGVFGTLLIILGLFLRFSGVLRVDEEDDKIYVYAGDVKVDISSIFGTSSVLIGAALAEKWDEDTFTRVAEYSMDGLFINDILERHSWNQTAWDKLITETESFLLSWTPQFWQSFVAFTNDKKIRYSSGIKGGIERWLNSWIPRHGNRVVNPYTGELETKYATPFWGEFFKKGYLLGAKVYTYDIDEVERMSRELGVNKNELTGRLTITLKDGSKKEYSLDREDLNKYYGSLNKASLEKIKSQKHTLEMPDGTYKTLSWDKMSDDQRGRVINRVMNNNAEIAKIYIWTKEMQHKYYADNSLWSELRRLGITRNVYKGDKGFVE